MSTKPRPASTNQGTPDDNWISAFASFGWLDDQPKPSPKKRSEPPVQKKPEGPKKPSDLHDLLRQASTPKFPSSYEPEPKKSYSYEPEPSKPKPKSSYDPEPITRKTAGFPSYDPEPITKKSSGFQEPDMSSVSYHKPEPIIKKSYSSYPGYPTYEPEPVKKSSKGSYDSDPPPKKSELVKSPSMGSLTSGLSAHPKKPSSADLPRSVSAKNPMPEYGRDSDSPKKPKEKATRPLSSGLTGSRPMGGHAPQLGRLSHGARPPQSPRLPSGYSTDSSPSSSPRDSPQITPSYSAPSSRDNSPERTRRLSTSYSSLTPRQTKLQASLDESLSIYQVPVKKIPSGASSKMAPGTSKSTNATPPAQPGDRPEKIIQKNLPTAKPSTSIIDIAVEIPKLNIPGTNTPTDAKLGPSIGDFDPTQLPPRKPLNEMTKDELMEHVTLLESQNMVMITEKEALSKTVNELIGVVSELSASKQTLTSQNSSLSFERQVLIQQLNETLTVAGEAPALKKANEGLKKQLKRQGESHQETISMMEEKLQTMQAHVELCTQQLTKSQEQLAKVTTQHEALQEVWEGSLQKQTAFAVREFKFSQSEQLIKALDVENPKLAIQMLGSQQKEHYIYTCKSIDSKRELLKEALASGIPDVIGFITAFLRFSLNEALFESIVMTNHEASSIFLRDLKERDPIEYAEMCLKYNRMKEYGTFKLQEALQTVNQDTRARKLEKVLELCNKHPGDLGSLIPAIESHIIDAKLKPIM